MKEEESKHLKVKEIDQFNVFLVAYAAHIVPAFGRMVAEWSTHTCVF